MAKVVITIDTEEKTMAVDMDGAALANAHSVSAYRDSSGEYIYVEVTEYEQTDNKVSKTTRYSASGSEKFKADEPKADFSEASKQVQSAFSDLFARN